MPNYDYVCEDCGKEFEVFQSMKDDRLEECLDDGCEGRMRRKIGTGAGLIFKGSGFYETDYRSESYKAAASKDSAAASSGSSEGGSSSKSDSSSSSSSKSSGDSGKSSSAGSGSGATASKGE